ncbi:hypothetical protein [Xanthomonas bundabergensis]|uniref:hypothetical protein n=1 Tax=Xanthomonas bundabergensis TaxID=3160842 RepID=UPI0035163EBC
MKSTKWKMFAAQAVACLALCLGTTAAQAACPYPFRLSGNIDQQWKQVTNSAWNKMLPRQWADNGFHFYSRVRDRGPADGINTPSDLESEILKKVREEPEGTPNRWQIVLPILNSKGANLRVIYDYDGGKTSKCQLVTLSY